MCIDGICNCSGGYSGMYCSSPASCAGVIDMDGQCCVGVLKADGSCCAGATAVISSDGTCCQNATLLDACGVCGGTAKAVDVVGVCCSGAIAEDGLCCQSADFDSCGVCDGDDSSCNVEATIIVAPPVGSTAAEVVNDALKLQSYKDTLVANLASTLDCPTNSITITSVTATGSRRLHTRHLLATTLASEFKLDQSTATQGGGQPVSSANVLGKLSEAADDGGTGLLSSVVVGSVMPAAVCGNGVCELGERCEVDVECNACQKTDCPFVVRRCPSAAFAGGGECAGHGRCVSSSGACQCFSDQGYVGAACDECSAPDYMLNPMTHECIRVIKVFPTPSPTPNPSPAPTPMPTFAATSILVVVPTQLMGVSKATFTAGIQQAYRLAFAVEARTTVDKVVLSNIRDTSRRHLHSGTRLLATATVDFDTKISVADTVAAAAMISTIKDVTSVELEAQFAVQLAVVKGAGSFADVAGIDVATIAGTIGVALDNAAVVAQTGDGSPLEVDPPPAAAGSGGLITAIICVLVVTVALVAVHVIRRSQGVNPERAYAVAQQSPAAASDASAGENPTKSESPTVTKPLPKGWFQATDPNSGNTYFYTENGTTSWSRPTEEQVQQQIVAQAQQAQQV